MNTTYYHLLLVIALLFAFWSIIKPTWPLLAVAVIFILIALLGH